MSDMQNHEIEEGMDSKTNQPNFVAFRLAGQDYCVDILSVREISEWTHVTPLPKSPAHIRGVINLRGAVVPILDCPMRFGIAQPEAGLSPVIIVVWVGDKTLELMVDEVSEILNIPHSAVKPIPDAVDSNEAPLISGVIL
jgi:purine-binding chemotaxis protein CheW